MNGIKLNGVSLFIGNIPCRKQACFYFQEGSTIYPVAYINKKLLPDTERLWIKFIGETGELIRGVK